MRQILLLVTLVFLMSGCSDGDNYSFSGSGENSAPAEITAAPTTTPMKDINRELN